MGRYGVTMALVLIGTLLLPACGGSRGHDGDFVRQGATALEVELPETALRITEAFDDLLTTIEDNLEDGDTLLAAVTGWIEHNGPRVEEATRQLHHDLTAIDGPERRALEEHLGEHFRSRTLRWRSLRERIAREHPRQSYAITQRVTQLQPDA